ncbi:hypothetical protein MNBD_PLANCTO02-2861 [hydrothermal vent metagenome]|uniref:VWFA domain-containing protein n=1 Tax=hydrothermal vent metagenome TaxID=652676 RepID=A0A3B1DZM3_9ZZZZ
MLKREFLYYGTHHLGWLLFISGAIIVALVMIWMLMRYERHLVPRKVGYALLTLRLVVLALLFIVWLEPVISWTIDKEKTGRILVGVDLSRSMAMSDKQATKAEKLRWARALGMVGNSKINARLDRWQRAYDAGKEPVWVDENEIKNKEQRLQLVTARKANMQQVFHQVGQLSRKEIALKLLTATSSPLLEKLSETGQVNLVVFAGASEGANSETLQELIKKPPENISIEISDLSAAMQKQAASSESSQLIGIVLLTDGQDNSQNDVIKLAKQFGNANVPIYPVLLGSEQQPRDIAVGLLTFDSMPRKDDKAMLSAMIHTAGFEGKSIDVFLEREGEEPLKKTIVPTETRTNIEFELNTKQKGWHEQTIRIDVQAGETYTTNNEKRFAYSVIDDLAHVMLIDGEARWEFKFIYNALKRDKQVSLKEVLFEQPYLKVLPTPSFNNQLKVPTDVNDLKNSPFAEQDIVIIGDISPEAISETGWKLLEQYVSEMGGTVLFVAGKQYFPLKHNNPVLTRLLPMKNLRTVEMTGDAAIAPPSERGFRLTITPDGEREKMFRFSSNRIGNRSIWKTLPGHTWGILGEAKPGATVLATALLPDVKPTLKSERTSALIVQQNYGLGKTMWIGIESTWRWRFRVGDSYHHRFWGQLCRWAALNRAATANEFVQFGLQESVIQKGEEVIFQARWKQHFLNEQPLLKAKVEIYRKGESTTEPYATCPLVPSESNPLLYEGRQIALPEGEYETKLIAEGIELGNDVVTQLYVTPRQTVELSELAANKVLLSKIADASQGKLFLPDQVHKIPELFQNPELKTALRHERTLWDHWLIMLLFFSLLMAEWVTRKLNGLP